MDSERRYFPSRAMITEPSSPLGDIKINLEVIANIIRLTVLEVEGVLAVGGSLWHRIESLAMRRKDVIDGVALDEEGDGYAVRVRVQVLFGVELSHVAYEIQERVRDNLQKMANVSATRVDVVVDNIKKVTATKENNENHENNKGVK
jgi:uncharacterized alkaline shock family protein YloU